MFFFCEIIHDLNIPLKSNANQVTVSRLEILGIWIH